MSPSSDLLELLPKSNKWPEAIRKAFFKKHMSNTDRFKVTVFFLENGIAPYVIKNCYEHRFKFDKSAWSQINWIINTWPTSNWTAWNCTLGRSSSAQDNIQPKKKSFMTFEEYRDYGR